MDRRSWIAQAYGYLVCLIAVVTFLISLHGLVDAAFRLTNPADAEIGYDPALATFEGYRSMRAERGARPDAAPAQPPEAELRAEYEAMRASRIAQGRYQARRSITTNGLLLVVSLVLFAAHWIWLRRAGEAVVT